MADSNWNENTPRPWHSIIAAGMRAAARASLDYVAHQDETASSSSSPRGAWYAHHLAWHTAVGPWAHITVDGIDFAIMRAD
ncbi:hypothetical protein pkur_cds_343 [Pandoravirus kuranda]|uniref:Uncharacterized protein n=1 Tax=Pandoravirus kuranda TaxID=3019033 RepID=A0AA95J4A5_9VIRU|nr:hypothetical protein pkur_cds_343 [Pandoravirus kuranda]